MDEYAMLAVQRSYIEALRHGSRLAEEFYAHLFARAPQLRPLLARDLFDAQRQLLDTLTLIVANLPRLYSVLPELQRAGQWPPPWEGGPPDSRLPGDALIAALATTLGPAHFPPATRAAWEELYGLLSRGAVR